MIYKYFSLHLFLVIFISLIIGCSTIQLLEEPITDLSKRYIFESFSILPPQGNNWFLLLNEQQGGEVSMLFGKKTGSDILLGTKDFQPHSIRALVNASGLGDKKIGSPQEFFDMVTKNSDKYEDPSKRFTLIKNTVTQRQDIGKYCIMKNEFLEDRGVPDDPEKLYFFDVTSLICLDVKNKIGVLLTCSQRTPSIDAIIDIKGECELFFKSIKFD